MQEAIRSKPTIKVKLDEEIMNKIIKADSFNEVGGDESRRKLYEHNCNLRELEIYKLFKKFVQQMNEKLKMRQEKMRLIEEGDGLYIEII